MKHFVPLLAGLLFGAGLALGGMTQPGKVVGFLDLAGSWDPSLAFVMGGALLVTVPMFALARRRTQPLFDNRFHLPTRKDIDTRLVTGAALFGIGWGLAGYCPGPALASLSAAQMPAAMFCVAMIAGMGIEAWLSRRRR